MNKIITVTLYSFFFSALCFGQEKLSAKSMDRSMLPKGISFKGNFKNALCWTDSLGENIVVLTETGETPSPSAASEDYRDAALYAYHFLVYKDSIRPTWKVYDFIRECPLDIEANYIKNTFRVTDLDNDGIGEVWLMYKTVCHGDVSPSDMKIIMYEGPQKFAMRGQNKVQISETEFVGGDYKFDKAFTSGPAQFRDFAKKLWKANMVQKWD